MNVLLFFLLKLSSGSFHWDSGIAAALCCNQNVIYVLLIVTAVSCCVQNTFVSVCGLAWRVHIFYWDTHLYNANIVQNGADYQITLAPRQHWRFGVNSLDWTQSPCKLFWFLIFRSANVYRMRFELNEAPVPKMSNAWLAPVTCGIAIWVHCMTVRLEAFSSRLISANRCFMESQSIYRSERWMYGCSTLFRIRKHSNKL